MDNIIPPIDIKIKLSNTNGTVWANNTNIKWIDVSNVTPSTYEADMTNVIAAIYNIKNTSPNKIIIPVVSAGGYSDLDTSSNSIKLAVQHYDIRTIDIVSLSATDDIKVSMVLEEFPQLFNLTTCTNICYDAYNRGILFLVYDIETKEIRGYYLANYNPQAE